MPTEAHNRISNLQNLTDAKPWTGAPFFRNPTLRNFEPRIGFAWNPPETLVSLNLDLTLISALRGT